METIGEFTFKPCSDKHTEDILKNSKDSNDSFLIVNPSNTVMTPKFKNSFEKIRNFKVYPDDTWVVTFPKCGTTWTQEMVWLLVNNFDYEKAKSTTLHTRFPFMEWETIRAHAAEKTIELAANLPRPRCIKSHLPLQLLPKELWTVKPKVIYVARDPKDVVTSYYHHHRLWTGYKGKFEDFAEAFLADRVLFAPFWSHVMNFYKVKDEPNILFNTYEEMKRDLSGVIKKTANFLNITVNDDEAERLREHLSFKNMKNNDSCNYNNLAKAVKEKLGQDDENLNFMRQGESGGWKKALTDDLIAKFDEWNKKSLEGTGFDKYPWS